MEMKNNGNPTKKTKKLITRVIQTCIPKSFLSAELRKNRNTELQTRNSLRSALGGYTQAENARPGYKSDKVI